MTFSGAGFVVPAALGHGDGQGQGQRSMGDRGMQGRGPESQGPPAQASQFGGGDSGHQWQGGGNEGQGNGPGGGDGHGRGNGGGNGQNGFGQGGNDQGFGGGQGSGNSARSAAQVAPQTQVVQAVNQGNGNGGGRGEGNGNGRGNGGGRGNGNGNGRGNGGGNGNGRGRGNGNGGGVNTTRGPLVTNAASGVSRGPNAPGPTATTAAAAPPRSASPASASSAPTRPPASSPASGTPASAPAPSTPAPVTGTSVARTPTTSLGSGKTAHRRRGSGRARVGASSSPAPSAAGTLGVSSGARNALLSAGLNSTAGSAASPNIVGALAPGTATLGHSAGSAAAGRRSATKAATATRSRESSSSILSPAGTVIERFINVIPIGVWLALAAALGLAALAGVAALRSGHRMRLQAGEVAAVTAVAVTDPLTGVLNRRGFIEAAERELERAGRYGHPMALAFVDIRGLKAVNDSEGHLAGDRLLQRVTTLLRDSARTHDVVGRIGGDELAVLLAEQSGAGAAAMTQRVRAHVPAARSSLRLATPWDVTIGTATFPEDGDTLEKLLAAADRRLYEQRGIQLS